MCVRTVLKDWIFFLLFLLYSSLGLIGRDFFWWVGGRGLDLVSDRCLCCFGVFDFWFDWIYSVMGLIFLVMVEC